MLPPKYAPAACILKTTIPASDEVSWLITDLNKVKNLSIWY